MGPGSGEYHGSTCFEFNAQLLRVWLVLVYTTIRGFDLDQKKKTIASKFQCFFFVKTIPYHSAVCTCTLYSSTRILGDRGQVLDRKSKGEENGGCLF